MMIFLRIFSIASREPAKGLATAPAQNSYAETLPDERPIMIEELTRRRLMAGTSLWLVPEEVRSMMLARRLTLLAAMLATFAISACSEPMGSSVQQAHTCNPQQAGCSGD
jgi:hypothetical protein